MKINKSIRHKSRKAFVDTEQGRDWDIAYNLVINTHKKHKCTYRRDDRHRTVCRKVSAIEADTLP